MIIIIIVIIISGRAMKRELLSLEGILEQVLLQEHSNLSFQV